MINDRVSGHGSELVARIQTDRPADCRVTAGPSLATKPLGDISDCLLISPQMRRGFSIVLVLIFCLVPPSALIDAGENASLPACCRRQGEHHCSTAVQRAMKEKAESGSAPALAAPVACPDYPGSAAAFSTPRPALTVSVQGATALMAEAQTAPDTPAAPTWSPSEAQSERGPPSCNRG
jgi:hypothetical protein